MRLRAETFILLSSFHSSRYSKLLYMHRSKSSLKWGISHLIFPIGYQCWDTGKGEFWAFSTYREATKKNVSLPLDCLSSQKKQFLAPVKAFISGKRGQRTNRWLHFSPNMSWGVSYLSFSLISSELKDKRPLWRLYLWQKVLLNSNHWNSISKVASEYLRNPRQKPWQHSGS